MARVRSLRGITARIYIPPTYGALYKIEVTRSDGTLDDITDIIHGGEVIDGATDTIGSFEFTVDNSNESFTNVWTGNEAIRLYIDYDTSATTVRFRGIIEKVSYQDTNIKIKGRSDSLKLLGVTVTKSYENIETSVILKDLFDNYATDFTYTNVNASTTNITVNWYQKPFWDCVIELCSAAGFDAYVDKDLDAHFFESGSINNTTEAVVHESNLFEVGDFAKDFSLIKNRIIVYGDKLSGQQILATSDDETSQTDNGVKELIIKDSNIRSETQAQERADYELSIAKDPPIVGDVTSMGLATIQPGENVRISAPLSNLNPNYYKILTYRQNFNLGFLKTILTIEKEPKSIYHVIRKGIEQEQKLSEMTNPNEMKFSWINDFSTDTGAHNSTQIVDSVLKTDGASTGFWVSDARVLDTNATEVELRGEGDALSGTTYEVSSDGGATFQSLSGLNSKLTLSPPGQTLKLRITLNSASTQIKSINLFYNK